MFSVSKTPNQNFSNEETPQVPAGVDPEAIRVQAKYKEERDKRIGKGLTQYVKVDGKFAPWLKDPWREETPREPIQKKVDVLILGGGYGSQLAAVELLNRGIDNFLMVEKCGGFGGTW